MATTDSTWSQRLVPVPAWLLVVIGASTIGTGGALGITATKAEALDALKPSDVAEMRSYLVRIDGRLEAMERENATLRAELLTLRRDVNALRADVDVLQRNR